jgi:hypothetical protein
MSYRTVVILSISGGKKLQWGPGLTVLFPVYAGPSVWKERPPSYSTYSPVTAEVAADV